MSYSLPKHVHPHIELVYPTTYFGDMRAMSSTVQTFKADKSVLANYQAATAQRIQVSGLSNGTVDPSCGQMITPDCLLVRLTLGFRSARLTQRVGLVQCARLQRVG